jgi:hypothetical protein
VNATICPYVRLPPLVLSFFLKKVRSYTFIKVEDRRDSKITKSNPTIVPGRAKSSLARENKIKHNAEDLATSANKNCKQLTKTREVTSMPPGA